MEGRSSLADDNLALALDTAEGAALARAASGDATHDTTVANNNTVAICILVQQGIEYVSPEAALLHAMLHGISNTSGTPNGC
jgi:hypothetical protein